MVKIWYAESKLETLVLTSTANGVVNGSDIDDELVSDEIDELVARARPVLELLCDTLGSPEFNVSTGSFCEVDFWLADAIFSVAFDKCSLQFFQ